MGELFLTVFLNVWATIGVVLSFIITCALFLFAFACIYWCIPTGCKKIGDLIYDYKEQLAKKKAKKEGKKYPLSVPFDKEKLNRSIEEHDLFKEKHPILEFFCNMRCYLWYRVPDYPTDIKRYVRMWYQRAVRGWSISDAWGFNFYLANVIKEGCEWLRENKHGVPCSCFPNTMAVDMGDDNDEEMNKAIEEWNKVLENIIWTFETANKIADHNWIYPHGKRCFNKKEKEEWEKFCDKMNKDYSGYHVMTKRECDKYRKGWKYFEEHFFGLWD